MPVRVAQIASSPSKTLLIATSAFVGAVLVHAWDVRRWGVPPVVGVTAATLLAAAAVWRGFPRVRLALLLLGAAGMGIARFDAAVPMRVSAAKPPFAEAWYQGRLAQEPKIGLKGAIMLMDRVFVFSDADRPQAGEPVDEEFQLSVRILPHAEIGDVLRWRCKAFLPPDTAGISRQPWRCAPQATPQVVAAAHDSAIANVLLRFKNAIRSVVRQLVPEPDASFVLGLLVGDTGGLPKEVVSDFRSTGTSHVLAVSGYNVSLVANFAFGLFAFFLLRRRAASVAVALFVTVFALLAGAGAPVVRAALMGGTAVVAELLGRRNAGWGALLLAAAIMLAFDPLVAATDVGFRLSFAAVVGMRAFGKPFVRLLSWLPEAFGVRAACAETLSATVATLPIELHDFGTLPIAALPVNVVIAPLVPFATAVGAVSALLGSFWFPLGMPFALAATIATRAMRWCAATGAKLAPALHMQATTGESLFMAVVLLLLWFALSRYEREQRERGGPRRVTLKAYEK